jgi:hypothetical protein
VVCRWEGGATHSGPAFSDFLLGSFGILISIYKSRPAQTLRIMILSPSTLDCRLLSDKAVRRTHRKSVTVLKALNHFLDS